jgi:hypothetical protein
MPRLSRQRRGDETAPVRGCFPLGAGRLAVGEFGHHPAAKVSIDSQICSCRFMPLCCTNMTWSNPGPLVAHEVVAQLRRGADAAAPGIVGQLVLHFQKAVPQIGDAGLVLAEQRIIAERVAEEAKAVETAADRLVLVAVARHAADQCDVRVDSVADRHALVGLDDRVIFLDPVRRLLGLKEGESQCP